jgi:hypothetical protein
VNKENILFIGSMYQKQDFNYTEKFSLTKKAVSK